MKLNYLTYTKFYNILQDLNESILLMENIFDLQTYTKKHKEELQKAINELSEEAKKKYEKIYNYLMNKYPAFYKEFDLQPIYIYDGRDKEILEIMTEIIKFKTKENITSKQVEKLINLNAPFEISFDFDLKNKENKKEKLKGKIIFICVPINTFFNRLYRVNNYRYITSALLNHPLWSKIEYLIFLLHELIEAEEDTFENRTNHYTGKIFIEYKNKNYSISNHHSIIVLAKEAVVLNKYKHIKALQKLRELRYDEWKVIKSLTGIDLSTLNHLDSRIIKKLLNIKKSEIKLKDKKIEGIKDKYENVLNTSINGLINSIKNLITFKLNNDFNNKINIKKFKEFKEFEDLK